MNATPPSTDATSSGARRASVPFILVVLVLDTLGIGVIIPVLPRLLAGFVRDDLAVASKYYGAFVAVYALMQFVFAPIIGGLSDKVGRRPVILVSLLGAALDYVLLAFAPSLAWLFVGRVVAGVTGASFAAATARPPSDARRATGWWAPRSGSASSSDPRSVASSAASTCARRSSSRPR
jgi:MFS family permease